MNTEKILKALVMAREKAEAWRLSPFPTKEPAGDEFEIISTALDAAIAELRGEVETARKVKEACAQPGVREAMFIASVVAGAEVKPTPGEPLPCPFCDAHPFVSTADGLFQVGCKRSRHICVSGWHHTREFAVAAWNTRANIDTPKSDTPAAKGGE